MADIQTMDIVHFWTCALNCSNTAGDHPFKERASFALECLTIPVSNAVVEHMFSFLAAIKTKQRNRLQLLMLDSLMQVQAHL